MLGAVPANVGKQKPQRAVGVYKQVMAGPAVWYAVDLPDELEPGGGKVSDRHGADPRLSGGKSR